MAVPEIAFLAGLVLLLAASAEGILCYSCQLSGGDIDFTCLDNPENVLNNVVNCPKTKYCTTIRIENIEDDFLYSFHRGCATAGQLYVNKTITDAERRTHYTYCSWKDKCNAHDGTFKNSGGGKQPPWVVPGSGAAGWMSLFWLVAATSAATTAAAFRLID